MQLAPQKVKEPTENERILGCLCGGAAGDALGYPVEFMRLEESAPNTARRESGTTN